MREWSLRCFNELAGRLSALSGISVVKLDSATTFDEMLSLIEHCAFLVGNDSGPAILAQCFGRPTYVIFGATDPKLILLRDDAIGIWKDVGCNGCKHFARHTDIECASPLCLEHLTVDDVLDQMLSAGWLVRLCGHGEPTSQTVKSTGEQ
jgi:ADP-heptose:LPS heptosyltransferase